MLLSCLFSVLVVLCVLPWMSIGLCLACLGVVPPLRFSSLLACLGACPLTSLTTLVLFSHIQSDNLAHLRLDSLASAFFKALFVVACPCVTCPLGLCLVPSRPVA